MKAIINPHPESPAPDYSGADCVATDWRPMPGSIATISAPLKWAGPELVVVNAAVFAPETPIDFVDQLFAIMAWCPQHHFVVLTSHEDLARKYFADPHEAIQRVQKHYCGAVDAALDADVKRLNSTPPEPKPPDTDGGKQKKKKNGKRVEGLGGGFTFAKLGPVWPLTNVTVASVLRWCVK